MSSNEKITMEELARRRLNVAIKDKNHLKEWLDKTGRGFLVFNSSDLVDALSFPEGVDEVMRIVARYRDYRRLLPSGRVERVKDPVHGREIEFQANKDELLEEEEMNQLFRMLIRDASERFPGWSLDKISQ